MIPTHTQKWLAQLLNHSVTGNRLSKKYSEGNGCGFFSNSNILIEDSFAYEANQGGLVLADSCLMLDDDSNVSISHNFDHYTAVLYAEMSSIELYSGSTILFLNNMGGHSGAIYLL